MGAKTNLELVQEIFETRLNSLNEKIDINNRNLTDKITSDNKYVLELLTSIKGDTNKTNGRVVSLDQELRELTSTYQKHLLTSADMEDIDKLYNKIGELDKENFIIKVWNRYPKQLLAIIVTTVILSIATITYTLVTVRNNIVDMNHTEQRK